MRRTHPPYAPEYRDCRFLRGGYCCIEVVVIQSLWAGVNAMEREARRVCRRPSQRSYQSG